MIKEERKINEACIADFILKLNDISVCYTTLSGGMSEQKISLDTDESKEIVVYYGDTRMIGYGGTDNWGKDRLAIPIDPKRGSETYDTIMVDNITVDQYAGENNWCRCENIGNNVLKYTAETTNMTGKTRFAYFTHKTTDATIKRGFFAGRNALPTWIVTVVQEPANESDYDDGGNARPLPPHTEPDIVYTLIPSVEKIIRHTDGTFEPEIVTAKCIATEGNTVTENPSEASIDYSYDLINWASTEIATPSSANAYNNTGLGINAKIYFRLNLNGNVVSTISVGMEQETTPDEPVVTPVTIDDYINGETKNYSVGLISDVHFSVDPTDTSFYKEDFENALTFYSNQNVSFVAGCGDYAENDKDDIAPLFTLRQVQDDPTGNTLYNNTKYMNPGTGFAKTYRDMTYKKGLNIPLYTCMGNHDMMLTYEDDGNYYSDEHTSNPWEFVRYLGFGKDFAWGDGEPININVFEFDRDLYPRKDADGNYTQYKSAVSKRTYYIDHGTDRFIFLSPYYGLDRFPATESHQTSGDWKETHINPTNRIDTTSSDKYIKQMTNYAKLDGYDSTKETRYDFQFYFPLMLIWLKDKIEEIELQGGRAFVFTHYFFPHKAGNGSKTTALQTDGTGGYFYSKNGISPMTFTKQKLDNGTSIIPYNDLQNHANSLCGVQFHFLNKLINDHPNSVWFSGHSHFMWLDVDRTKDNYLNFCNNDFEIIMPTGSEAIEMFLGRGQSKNKGYTYLYSRSSETPKTNITSGLAVHLPSTTRTTSRVNDSGVGAYTRYFEKSQGGILDVYDNFIVVRGYDFIRNNDGSYTNELVTRALYTRDGQLITE